jgi:hypothetical protein
MTKIKTWIKMKWFCPAGLHDPVPELIGFPWITCHRCGTPLN